MLTHLHIKDFAIIEHLDLALQPGMTIITGETGAGKSIMMDALEIALGDRAESNFVRQGSERSEISLTFNLEKIPAAKAWLEEHDLDDDQSCILRRVFDTKGRSRNFINGSPTTLQSLRHLGTLLINIQAQHSQYQLLKRDEQRQILDDYATHLQLCTTVAQAFECLEKIKTEIQSLEGTHADPDDRLAFLRYQIEELNELAIKPNELEALHQEQKQLACVDQHRSSCEKALSLLSDEPGLLSNLYELEQLVSTLAQETPDLKNTLSLIKETCIQFDEVQSELRHYGQDLHQNPERLHEIEQRLDRIHTLARKHRIKPEELLQHHEKIKSDLETLEHRDERLSALKAELAQQEKHFDTTAQELSASRKKAAIPLEKAVTAAIQQLDLPHAEFRISFLISPERTRHGMDQIEFLITTNRGQPPQPLNKIASGGELSRISLAIHVITAQLHLTPTLIFDEVDVGIGGGPAQIVGQLLRKLGQSTQVLCITHLAQVAALGNHHLRISKSSDDEKTVSSLAFLTQEERVHELARMLGGLKITKTTQAHAQEMLNEFARAVEN